MVYLRSGTATPGRRSEPVIKFTKSRKMRGLSFFKLIASRQYIKAMHDAREKDAPRIMASHQAG